jgi:hypothetical protein
MPDGTSASARMRRTAVGLAVMTGLTVTACSQAVNPVGNGAPTSPPSPATSTASTSGDSDSPVSPLTGLPASASAAAKPAVVVAVSGSDPQGLGSADVVYEEISSPIRYLAVYQSKSGTDVGPVTTTQFTDRFALSVLHPLFAYNGAPAGFIVAELDRTKIIDAGYAKYASLYTTGSDGLDVTSTQAVADGVHGGTAPPPLFSYRNMGAAGNSLATSGVTRPTTVSVTVPGAGTQDWTFDQQADRWTQTSVGQLRADQHQRPRGHQRNCSRDHRQRQGPGLLRLRLRWQRRHCGLGHVVHATRRPADQLPGRHGHPHGFPARTHLGHLRPARHRRHRRVVLMQAGLARTCAGDTPLRQKRGAQ